MKNIKAENQNILKEKDGNNTMKQKLIRLTESDLHTVIKEVIQNLIDAEPYQGFDDDGEFDNAMRMYTKMPNGYDRDIDADDWKTADKIALRNKNYESEAFPYVKEREKDASWKALSAKRNRPIYLPNDFSNDYRNGAKNFVRGRYA